MNIFDLNRTHLKNWQRINFHTDTQQKKIGIFLIKYSDCSRCVSTIFSLFFLSFFSWGVFFFNDSPVRWEMRSTVYFVRCQNSVWSDSECIICFYISQSALECCCRCRWPMCLCVRASRRAYRRVRRRCECAPSTQIAILSLVFVYFLFFILLSSPFLCVYSLAFAAWSLQLCCGSCLLLLGRRRRRRRCAKSGGKQSANLMRRLQSPSFAVWIFFFFSIHFFPFWFASSVADARVKR